MKRIKYPIIFLLSFIIVACSTQTIEIEKPFIAHPTLPKGVKSQNIQIEVANIDNKEYILMTINDYQNMRIYMYDMLRYIKSMNAIVCSYREELQEDFCLEKNK